MRTLGLLSIILGLALTGCAEQEPKTQAASPPVKVSTLPSARAFFKEAELGVMFARLNRHGGKMSSQQIIDIVRLSKGLKSNQVQEGPMALQVQGKPVEVLIKIERVGPDRFSVTVTHPTQEVIKTIEPSLKKPHKN